MWLSYWLSDKLTKGRLHGSAVAILIGLLLSYIGGVVTGGQKGLVDIALFSGIGLLGGAMLRDFAIVATGFGVSVEELKRAGMVGVLARSSGCSPPSSRVLGLPWLLATRMRLVSPPSALAR
ncbi:malonate transporter, MadM subunit [Pseudomonas saudiphocaensis]|uniref:Malonate transporter, MadM subunit n=1 Tax=Pseudomonas saudiphocaensis TaxID=1499686 RepID=A0A078M066_9PSED|nr:malonate transporter, MadM subunit [Pseudomonas saudiphocaensis]